MANSAVLPVRTTVLNESKSPAEKAFKDFRELTRVNNADTETKHGVKPPQRRLPDNQSAPDRVDSQKTNYSRSI